MGNIWAVMLPMLLGAFLFFHAGPPPAPSPLDGEWAGQVSGSSGSYYVGLTVRPGGSAIVHYSGPLDCDGTWHEVSHEGNVYTYRETIVYDYKSVFPQAVGCANGATIVMNLAAQGGTVAYSASGSGSGGASGQLSSVTPPETLPPEFQAAPE